MSLLGDIINELADKDVSLSFPLLKTKILATRLQNKPLMDWVKRELGGYGIEDSLPDYRSHIAKLAMDCTNGLQQQHDHPVPTAQLPEDIRTVLRSLDVRQPVAALESLVASDTSGIIEVNVPAEVVFIVQNSIRQMGNRRFQIHAFRKTVSITVIAQVLANVRERLLDFVLELEKEFGEETDIQILKQNNSQITNIMNTTINTTGSGNVINTGNHATVSANVTITTGNKDHLTDELQKQGVSQPDIEELMAVIDQDKPQATGGSFGPNVNGWIQKMVGKALDNTWKVGIGAAGGVLAGLIKSYYGIGQ